MRDCCLVRTYHTEYFKTCSLLGRFYLVLSLLEISTRRWTPRCCFPPYQCRRHQPLPLRGLQDLTLPDLPPEHQRRSCLVRLRDSYHHLPGRLPALTSTSSLRRSPRRWAATASSSGCDRALVSSAEGGSLRDTKRLRSPAWSQSSPTPARCCAEEGPASCCPPAGRPRSKGAASPSSRMASNASSQTSSKQAQQALSKLRPTHREVN